MVTALLLAGLPAVALAGMWRLGGVSALEDDLLYYLPVREYIGRCLAAGQPPLWNPLVSMGTSVAADPQAGLWYPATWLFALLPWQAACPLNILLHFVLAGAGMYRFLRACRHEGSAALLGALAFQMGGFAVAHRAHLTILQAAAWLPWMLYAWQRYADDGRPRHLRLAVAATGLQLLVQHLQVSAISLTLLAAYVLAVLAPRRPSLGWRFPSAVCLGTALAAVQIIPAWRCFAASGRAMPAYHLFIENAWHPVSAVLLLFPMLMGARTPLEGWTQPWWGLSHFCEQSAYASVVVLTLAASSLGLLRNPAGGFPRAGGRIDRTIAFWWLAVLAALLLALGDATPLGRLLFHVPVYRNFRAPARWILVWSVAMPVLASAAASTMLKTAGRLDGLSRHVRRAATCSIPLAAAGCLAALASARWRIDELTRRYGDCYDAARVLHGLREAARWDNPAVLWPLILIAVGAWLIRRWARNPRTGTWAAVLLLAMVDLAVVAGLVDIDRRTYERADLMEPPPLARAIRSAGEQTGRRLLVPRAQADYARPLEVLSPQINVLWSIPVFNGYGPLGSLAGRMLFQLAPWGASEGMLELLRNRPLMRAMGIGFLAARSRQERELIDAALTPAIEDAPAVCLFEAQPQPAPVVAGQDLLWPVKLDGPGLYEICLEVEPVPGEAGRWFLRLETAQARGLTATRCYEPSDLACGPRRLRPLFRVDEQTAEAVVRVKAERGRPVIVRQASLRRITGPVVPAPREASGGTGGWIRHPGIDAGIDLWELPEPAPLAWLAAGVEQVRGLAQAVAALEAWSRTDVPPLTAVVEGLPADYPATALRTGRVRIDRARGHEILLTVDAPDGGLVVFNQTWDPGWSAWVDGQPRPILRANAVCQGVVVPPGGCQVRFAYRPAGLGVGLAISGAAVAVLVLGSVAGRRDAKLLPRPDV